jgi:hypothetical protein
MLRPPEAGRLQSGRTGTVTGASPPPGDGADQPTWRPREGPPLEAVGAAIGQRAGSSGFGAAGWMAC